MNKIGQKAENIKGQFTKTIFKNNDGFVIGVFKTDSGEEIIAKGTIIPFPLKQKMEISGIWEKHPKFGEQIKILSYEIDTPKDSEAILAYLSSGLIAGVGVKTAEKIIDYFGDEALEIIKTAPHRLTEVPKIGRKTASNIFYGLKEHQEEQDIMLFLMGLGITALKASKIYKLFQKDTINKVNQNPYILTDVPGIGFPMADNVALKMGWDKEDHRRIEAGIMYFLKKSCYENGHAYLTKTQLLSVSSFNLEVKNDIISHSIADLTLKGRIVEEDGAIYIKYLFDTEEAIANAVCQENRDVYHYDNFYTTILKIEEESDITLTVQQRNAIWTALNAKLSVMTGGPGVGKTLTIKFLLKMLKDYGKKPICAAPTGRAAKRISEMTGFPAYTIHRLLGLRVLENDEEEDLSIVGSTPIPEYKNSNVLIIDESSMIDMPLMKSILDNLGDRQLLLVGDVDQLPSVGPGKIFKDIIDSGVADTVVLDEVFRQARESKIIQNALKINKGEMPDLTGGNNFEFKSLDKDRETVDFILNFLQYDAKKMGFDVVKDIQILAPMKKGICGINELNQLIQDRINPCYNDDAQLHQKSGVKYRVNDKVMQIVNNYDKGVYNGEWGFITNIDFIGKTLDVDFQDKIVSYAFMDLNEITHAYAQTIHKSQGSEFKCVIMPIVNSQRIMLQRNLLYTGVTRASEMLYIVGQEQAIMQCVNNNEPIFRNTKLKEKIIDVKQRYKKVHVKKNPKKRR